MLDCKPDKLAQNAPSQSEPWEARQAILGAHKQTSYPRVQWGNTLDKRETTDPRGKTSKLRISRSWGDRGECKVKEQSGL